MKKINQKGFSLIELILVVTIIGIIASIAIPSLVKAKEMAENGGAYSTLRTFVTLQVRFYAQNNRFGQISELNNGQDINLGTNVGNTLIHGKFTYTMTPANPTPAQLTSLYTIVGTRPGIGANPPTVFEVDQSGKITGIF